MKKQLITLLVFSFLAIPFANANTSFSRSNYAKEDRVYGNIHEGSWAISASSNQNFSTVWEEGATRSNFGLSTGVQYFGWDKIGVGGTFSIGSIGNNTTLKVGPSATYYFWNLEKAGIYVTPAFLFSTKPSSANGSPSSHFESTILTGMNYFIVPSVAFGPGLEFTHVFGRSGVKTANALGLNVNFSLYL